MLLRDLEIVRWAHGGDGVAYPAEGPLAGMVVFVPGGVPGDRVRAEVVKRKKRFARARILAVEVPAAGRVEPQCLVQANCGGCPWMTGDRATQDASRLEILRGEVRKTLRWEEARVSRDVTLAEHRGPSYGYRRRVRLAWQITKGEVRLGYRSRGTHQLVPIERCEVAEEPINEALEEVRAEIAVRGVRAGEVTLLSGQEGVGWQLVPDAGGRSLGGIPELSVGEGATSMSVGVEGFVQGNSLETSAIAEHISRLIGEGSGSLAVELFAGSGTWTGTLLDAGYEVEAYEVDGKARPRFEANTAGRPARLHVTDLLETGLPEPLPQGPKLVLLDPPRSGAAAVVTWLRASGADRIVMISCDVATGLRDTASLSEGEGGYDVRSITSYDMFPHTGHQELVVELRRRAT